MPTAFTSIASRDAWSPLLIALIASMTQAFGISIQRKSHLLYSSSFTPTNMTSANKRTTTPLYKRPLWISGFLIYTLSTLVGSTCTIGYLPIIILAPVGAIGLVFNAIFARIILGDPFTKKTILGTGLIVLGAGLIAGFGTTPEPNHTLKDLITLYKRPSFIIYFSIIEMFTFVGLFSTHVIEHIMNSRQNSKWWWAIQHPNLKTWLGISYGMFGANISSQAMLFAKSGLELLLLTLLHGDNQFIYPLTWVIVFALVLTAILQLYYLNRGVQLCDTIILVPLNFCSFNVSCLFNGLFYYNQWDRLYWWQLGAVIIGICILVCGVLLISFNNGKQPIALPGGDDDDNSRPFLKADATNHRQPSLDEEEADEAETVAAIIERQSRAATITGVGPHKDNVNLELEDDEGSILTMVSPKETPNAWWTRMRLMCNNKKPRNELNESTGMLAESLS